MIRGVIVCGFGLLFGGHAMAQTVSDDYIVRQNAPLGLTLAEAGKQLPMCQFSNNDIDQNTGYEAYPLTGYLPVFPDLTPNKDGTVQTTTRGTDQAKTTLPNGQIPTLDDGILTYIDVWCGDPNDSDAPIDQLILYKNKILAVLKSTVDKAGTDAASEMSSLAPGLKGQMGPLHTASSIQDGANVEVTYADDGNERTVLQTEDRHQSNWGLTWVTVNIAYVDTPLWCDYSAQVEPPRLSRRLFGLSHAAMGCFCSAA